MLTWNGQHHGSVASPNIHLYGHVHALYQNDSETCPVKDADAWPALDVGFDGHDYQVWSLEEILVQLRPKLAALEELKRDRGSSTRSAGGESGARSNRSRHRRSAVMVADSGRPVRNSPPPSAIAHVPRREKLLAQEAMSTCSPCPLCNPPRPRLSP